MGIRKQHRVTFYSPGTLFSEHSTRDIDSWDPRVAVEMAEKIVERYGAKPYGFVFSTDLVADPISDGSGGQLNVEPKELARSGTHFLGGTVQRYDELVARNDPKEEILRDNMSCNREPLNITGNSPWRWSHYFDEGDCVVNPDGSIRESGNDPQHRAYREEQLAKWKQEKGY